MVAFSTSFASPQSWSKTFYSSTSTGSLAVVVYQSCRWFECCLSTTVHTGVRAECDRRRKRNRTGPPLNLLGLFGGPYRTVGRTLPGLQAPGGGVQDGKGREPLNFTPMWGQLDIVWLSARTLPWGCIVRVVPGRPTKSRNHEKIPTRTTLPLFPCAGAVRQVGRRDGHAGPHTARTASRSAPPQWGSSRFRPLTCTYAPCGPSVRVDEPAKSRKNTHLKNIAVLSRDHEQARARVRRLPGLLPPR